MIDIKLRLHIKIQCNVFLSVRVIVTYHSILACEAEAPLVDGTPPVPDDHMTASSECGPIFCWPYLARLNFTGGTWCSSNLDLEPYIQVG